MNRNGEEIKSNLLLRFKSKGLFFCFCYAGKKIIVVNNQNFITINVHTFGPGTLGTLWVYCIGKIHTNLHQHVSHQNASTSSLAPHTSEYENFLPRISSIHSINWTKYRNIVTGVISYHCGLVVFCTLLPAASLY